MKYETFMEQRLEILWDTWGVPHIFAEDDIGLAYGFGWAQGRSHGDLLLTLYAQGRGRAAEYFGEAFLDSDKQVRTVGIPSRAEVWYEQQNPPFRTVLDAFVQGFNDYAVAHTETIGRGLEAVLPITGIDVLAHSHRVMHFTFVTTLGAQGVVQAWQELPGSNGWAVAPKHTANGFALLLGKPHLPWGDLFLFYEAQFTRPGYDFYGATLVGMPSLAFGFNDNLGWTPTVNTYNGADMYELTLQGDGYLFDGEVRPLELETQVLLVRQEDGSLREEPLVIARSVHGPVVAQQGERALALRVAGLDCPGYMEQWWEMTKATSLESFEAALKRMQVPMFNVIYADREGNILQLFNGLVPVRPYGDWNTWQAPVPGDSSEALWHDYHPYEDLPKVLNPESGWLQNANEAPWYMTVPYPLLPEDYPAYVAPRDIHPFGVFRTQLSQRMLLEDDAMSFETMLGYSFNAHSEMAERVLDELVRAAQAAGDDRLQEAAGVLAAWNRRYDADSQGAALFFAWAKDYQDMTEQASRQQARHPQESITATSQPFFPSWSNAAPALTIPSRLGNLALALRALENASRHLQGLSVPLDVAWGDVVRMRVGDYDLPASGGPSSDTFRVLTPESDSDGRYRVVHGDSFIFAVEFSQPIRANALMTYGNSTQVGSQHVGDQLELYANNQLRPVWRAREAIEANLSLREVLASQSPGYT